MRGSINKKLPFSTLALAVFLIVAAWFLLFFTIPFFVVPAALSNNAVLSSIGKRLIFSAMGFVALLVILARNRVSNRQFWEVFFCYGISWIVISNLGEGLAENVFEQRDTTSIDASNALFVTLINYATILGPAIVTLIISRRILFRENNKGAEGNQGDQRASSAETFVATTSTPSGGSQSINNEDLGEKVERPDAEEALKKPDRQERQTEEAPVEVDVKNELAPETSDATEKGDGWSEEYQILNEYDPVVKDCHDELEGLDPLLSSQFRDEVVSNRKKATDIRDRLKAQHENKLNPNRDATYRLKSRNAYSYPPIEALG